MPLDPVPSTTGVNVCTCPSLTIIRHFRVQLAPIGPFVLSCSLCVLVRKRAGGQQGSCKGSEERGRLLRHIIVMMSPSFWPQDQLSQKRPTTGQSRPPIPRYDTLYSSPRITKNDVPACRVGSLGELGSVFFPLFLFGTLSSAIGDVHCDQEKSAERHAQGKSFF